MGTNECSQPASKSSWDSQDFGDVNMVLKMVHFHKSSRPQWVNMAQGQWHHCRSTNFSNPKKYCIYNIKYKKSWSRRININLETILIERILFLYRPLVAPFANMV